MAPRYLDSISPGCHCAGRTLPAAQFDSIIAAGTAEAALARESEARALSETASLRREAITAWKQVEERQQALQALEVGLRPVATFLGAPHATAVCGRNMNMLPRLTHKAASLVTAVLEDCSSLPCHCGASLVMIRDHVLSLHADRPEGSSSRKFEAARVPARVVAG